MKYGSLEFPLNSLFVSSLSLSNSFDLQHVISTKAQTEKDRKSNIWSCTSSKIHKDLYVDDLNLIGTPEGLLETANYLKKEFEMKDLGKTRYYLGLQIEYFSNEILSINQHILKKS